MKAKIDKDGFLYIERAGVMKRTVCPVTDTSFNNDVVQFASPCGDWCPLFGEPEKDEIHSCIDVQTCQVTLSFSDLTDERKVIYD